MLALPEHPVSLPGGSWTMAEFQSFYFARDFYGYSQSQVNDSFPMEKQHFPKFCKIDWVPIKAISMSLFFILFFLMFFYNSFFPNCWFCQMIFPNYIPRSVSKISRNICLLLQSGFLCLCFWVVIWIWTAIHVFVFDYNDKCFKYVFISDFRLMAV